MQKMTLDGVIEGMEEKYATDDEEPLEIIPEYVESEDNHVTMPMDMFGDMNLAP